MEIDYAWQGDGYFTDFFSVTRWGSLIERSGTYRVIATMKVLAIAQMGSSDYAHPTCVVDDFGDLVKVPA